MGSRAESYFVQSVMIKAINRAWDRIPYNVKNRAIVLSQSLNRSEYVAHHGIERSGTNYISRCLEELSLTPVNKYNSPEDRPTHKHFRWQPNKDTIVPPFSSSCWSHYNELRVSSIHSLNKLAGYPVRTRHIVVKKELNSWLISILNYGLNVKWFLSEEDALSTIDIVKVDYKSYYDFWQLMERDFPSFVTVMHYENILKNPSLILPAIKQLGLRPKNENSFVGRFEEVYMSPMNRKIYLTIEDIRPYLNSD